MKVMLESIRRLVERLSPAPICEPCIGRRLDLPIDDALHAALGELAVERGFDRESGSCSLCEEHGRVIVRQDRRHAA
ncbi:hypothetical protein [Novosphingobium terrae]|uniref:hypothetical protein n=1 Tax=Novosphingobium terrae TaxID=2726189 RepID=UPI00197E531D|nr:hypothetical protein [Novosphingobium terrae]